MRFNRLYLPLILGSLLLLIVFSSCRKEPDYDEESLLALSVKEVLFDTVFTTVGSTTQYFSIRNDSDKPVLTSISLAGGNSSCFSVNVDGMPGSSFSDVEIPARDSLFIFVKVTVDPQSGNLPFVIKDSLVFTTNGQQQDVDLIAWGQNAHYIRADKWLGSSLHYSIVAAEGENVTWTNDLPYLIYGWAVVDSTARLNIEAGVRLHFYNNSGLWVYKGGSLHVNGTQEEPVVFQGPRLEAAYAELPGQWDRIWLNEGSVDNVINYAIIKNAYIGLQTETLDASMGNKLILSNTEIRNMSGVGLLSRFYRIKAFNTIISNCGVYNAALTTGGSYDFRHCTLANYWNLSTRTTPALLITNYYEDMTNGIVYTGDLDSAYFGNSIIYGSVANEFVADSVSDAAFHYHFQNCLLRREELNTSNVHFSDVLLNLDPAFTDTYSHNYRLGPLSAAIDAGNATVILSSIYDLTNDLLGNNRLVNPPPDLGAIDYRP